MSIRKAFGAFDSVNLLIPGSLSKDEFFGGDTSKLSNEGIGQVLSWYDDVEMYVSFLSINKPFNQFLKFQGPRFARNIRFKLVLQPTREFQTVWILEVCDAKDLSLPPHTTLFTKREKSIDISVFPNLRHLFVTSRVPLTLVSFKLLKNLTHLSIGNVEYPETFVYLIEKSNFQKLKKKLKENPLPQNCSMSQAYEHLEPFISLEDISFTNLIALKNIELQRNALIPRSSLNEIPNPLTSLGVNGSFVLPSIDDYRFSNVLSSLSLNNHQLKEKEMDGFVSGKKKEEEEEEETEGEEEKEKKNEEEEGESSSEENQEEGQEEKPSPPRDTTLSPVPAPPCCVTSLSLVSCDANSPVDFSSIGKIRTLLKLELRVRNSQSKVGDETFIHLNYLRSLQLRCFDVTGKTFNCPSLSVMKINCPKLTDEAFDNMEVLKILKLVECKQVRGVGFKKCCNTLVNVVLEDMVVFEVSVCVLRYTRKLHLLNTTLIKKDSGADFGNLVNMEELVVDQNPDITDHILLNMKRLKILRLSHCTGFNGEQFGRLEQLKVLDIINNSRIDGDKCLESLNNLKCVTFSKAKFTNEGFEHSKFLKRLVISRSVVANETMFKHLIFLTYLELEYCENMGKKMKKAVPLKRLEHLVLRNMTGISFKFFKLVPTILKLNVIQCKCVTGKGLVFLKELEEFRVEACIKFNFKNAFKILRKYKILKDLHIKNCKSKGLRLQKEIEDSLGDFLENFKIEY